MPRPAHQRAGVAVRAQSHVDAEHVVVGGGVGQHADQAPAQPREVFLGGQGRARAAGRSRRRPRRRRSSRCRRRRSDSRPPACPCRPRRASGRSAPGPARLAVERPRARSRAPPANAGWWPRPGRSWRRSPRRRRPCRPGRARPPRRTPRCATAAGRGARAPRRSARPRPRPAEQLVQACVDRRARDRRGGPGGDPRGQLGARGDRARQVTGIGSAAQAVASVMAAARWEGGGGATGARKMPAVTGHGRTAAASVPRSKGFRAGASRRGSRRASRCPAGRGRREARRRSQRLRRHAPAPGSLLRETCANSRPRQPASRPNGRVGKPLCYISSTSVRQRYHNRRPSAACPTVRNPPPAVKKPDLPCTINPVLRRVFRVVLIGGATLYFVAAGSYLGLRYALLPQVDKLRPPHRILRFRQAPRRSPDRPAWRRTGPACSPASTSPP